MMREFATDRLPSTTCIFSNILDLWGDPQSVEQCLGAHASFSAKVGAARSWPRYSHGWCLRHHRWCPYTNSECRAQGPPCPDWSSAGNRAGVAGKDLPTLLAGGAKMDLTQPCIGVIENSTHMPSGVVQEAYGCKYELIYTHQRPSQVGFEFIARDRTGFLESVSSRHVFNRSLHT